MVSKVITLLVGDNGSFPCKVFTGDVYPWIIFSSVGFGRVINEDVTSGFYVDRVAGRDRDYRDFDRIAVASRSTGS